MTSRAVAAFLLGWVFWSGLLYACRSRFFQQLLQVCWKTIHRTRPARDLEAQANNETEKGQNAQKQLSAIHRISNEAALAFGLNLCFAFAGFAEFCTLLLYRSDGDTACGPYSHTLSICPISLYPLSAFTVAWGSMAAQVTRLVGLVILVWELHARSAGNIEFYILSGGLVLGLCEP